MKRGSGAVRRRHVLFFGGFDPKGASWYHGLYRRHAALQSAVNGLALEVGPRRKDADGNAHWEVSAQAGGVPVCSSRIEVAAWDAIVRGHWPRSGAGILRATLSAYARILANGPRALLKVGRIAPRTLFALVYPLLFFLAGLLLTVLLAGGLAAAVLALGGGALPAALVLSAGVAFGLRAQLRLERRLDTSLLALIFAFVTRYAVRGVPELDAMLDRAAARIVRLVREGECDEVLVVGYSVGSILATRALARALETLEGTATERPALALLTLGNCLPLLGLFPQAGAYRAELARLAASDRIRWVDVSSPSDWCSFPLLDPLDVCAIEATRGRGTPLMTSPRFHKLFTPDAYAAMIRNKHTMHTLYLMSTQQAGRYDYFGITAGPEPLAARYAKAREARA